MNGFNDDDWNAYLKKLDSYKISSYIALYQKYLDAYFAQLGN